MNKKQKWFWIAFATALLAAPNALFIRYSVGTIDPFLVNAIRFGFSSLLCLPYVISHKSRLKGKALKPTLLASFGLAVAVTTYTVAIKYSSASYTTIIDLLSPVVLVWYSVYFTHERIHMRQVAGITLAAAGAAAVVLLPIALEQNQSTVFYPFATVMVLINCFVYPYATIQFKVANVKHRVPMVSLIGAAGFITTLTSLLLWLSIGQAKLPAGPVSSMTIVSIAYSTIVVALICLILGLISYEYTGSAVRSALLYFESLAGIVLPVIFLGEKISLTLAVGSCLILFGIFILEYQTGAHHKMRHIMRHR